MNYTFQCSCGWSKTLPRQMAVNCSACKRRKNRPDDPRRKLKEPLGRSSVDRKPAKKKRKSTAPLPCVFLGPLTGVSHKVSCSGHRLDEHLCLHAQREGRWGKRAEKFIAPKAIPGGKCRDLDGVILVSCVDCAMYRAGLLPAPPGGE